MDLSFVIPRMTIRILVTSAKRGKSRATFGLRLKAIGLEVNKFAVIGC